MKNKLGACEDLADTQLEFPFVWQIMQSAGELLAELSAEYSLLRGRTKDQESTRGQSRG